MEKLSRTHNSMKNTVLVDGLSALTDGHVALYYQLQKKGYSPLLLYRTADRMPSGGLDVKVVKVSKSRIFECLQFIFILFKERPSLVEFYLHEFGRLSPIFEVIKIVVCKIFRIPVTVVCTGSEILNFKSHGFLKKLSVKMALRASKYYLIKESYMKENIEKYNIADPNKALFIHNGVFESLKKCNFSGFKSDNVVLFFNSFKKWRNVDFIVEAAKRVLESRTDVVFLLVGARNDAEEESLKHALDSLPVGNQWRVQVHRMNDNKEFYFGLADLLVLPADLVWLNNSVLESMLLEVPVLLPDVEWVDKIVDEGVTGLIHKHKDLDSFVLELNKFFDMSSEKRKIMGESARAVMLDKFGSEKRALLHHLFYQSYFTDIKPDPELFGTENYEVKSYDEVKSGIKNHVN